MIALAFFGDKMSVKVTRPFRQLVNISVAAGKFIADHPEFELFREVIRLGMYEDEMLEDFEVHNSQFEEGEIITYDADEVKFFYSLLEISCRIFLCDIGDYLKKSAIENGETDEAEFNRVRSFYLKQAEEVITSIRRSFENDPKYIELFDKVEHLIDFN